MASRARQPVEVLPQVLLDQGGSRRRQLDRGVGQSLAEPTVRLPVADVGVDDRGPGRLFEGVDELGRELAAPAGDHQPGRGQRVLQVGDQGLELVGRVAAGIAQDHDAPVGQERRRGAGVHDHAEVQVLAAVVLQDQRPVDPLHQLADQVAHRLCHQGRVVTGDEPGRASGAAPTASPLDGSPVGPAALGPGHLRTGPPGWRPACPAPGTCPARRGRARPGSPG